MPSLKYYDQAAGSYKYVVGGLNQDTADARYLMSGFRNVIRNGDMQIAQRGNGPWSTHGTYYIVDGWNSDSSGGTKTISRTIQSPGLGSPLLVSAISGQAAAGDYLSIFSVIEDVATLSGQTVTLSFTAFAASGAPKIGIEIIQGFGTGGSPSSYVFTRPGAITIGTTAVRYTVTFGIPSIAGKIMGSNGNSKVLVNLWLSAGSTYASNASNIGIQNNTFSITDVQLEAGSVATPFERLPVQQQLAWCQRYFNRIGFGNPNVPWNNDQAMGQYAARSASEGLADIQFKVPMRASPSVSFANVADFRQKMPGGGGGAGTAMSAYTTAPAGCGVYISGGSGMTPNIPIYLTATSTGYIDASAEI